MNRRSFLLLIPVAAVAAAHLPHPAFPGLVTGWDLGADSSKTVTAVYRIAEDGKTHLVRYYDGHISESAIWNRLLTDDEMRELAQNWPARVVDL
jgi:hypothetical protein